jgi:hypothetical protein
VTPGLVKKLTVAMPRQVGRPALAELNTSRAEWVQVGGDFVLLPQEYGTGQQRLALYVSLGSAAARHGAAQLTGVQILPLVSQRRNGAEATHFAAL